MKVTSRLIAMVALAALTAAAALLAPGLMHSVAPLDAASISSTGDAYRAPVQAWHGPAHGASWERVLAAASR